MYRDCSKSIFLMVLKSFEQVIFNCFTHQITYLLNIHASWGKISTIRTILYVGEKKEDTVTEYYSRFLMKWIQHFYSLKTSWLKQPISLFIMWTTIILVKSTKNLVFLTNLILEPTLSLVQLTQSLLHLNHNSVSLTNIMVVHIMNNRIGCFN